MREPQDRSSALSRSVSGFANALAALGTFLLVPLMTRYIRPEIYRYLAGEFSPDVSLWGSWGFVVLLGFCLYYGVSAVMQMIVQWLFHRNIRRGGF